MEPTRRVRRLLSLAGLAAVLVAVPTGTASGSCAGPAIETAGAATPLGEGGPLVVRGSGFLDGCDDSRGTSTGLGCSAPRREPVTPQRAVHLELRQGDQRFDLGTADAATDGSVVWRVTLPERLDTGPATLVADDAELPVSVG